MELRCDKRLIEMLEEMVDLSNDGLLGDFDDTFCKKMLSQMIEGVDLTRAQKDAVYKIYDNWDIYEKWVNEYAN